MERPRIQVMACKQAMESSKLGIYKLVCSRLVKESRLVYSRQVKESRLVCGTLLGCRLVCGK